MRLRAGLILLRREPVVSSCEHGTALSGPVSGNEFFDYIGIYKLVKKDSALRSWYVCLVKPIFISCTVEDSQFALSQGNAKPN
jgi:hypothetical protein